jgi:hypothetical protein
LARVALLVLLLALQTCSQPAEAGNVYTLYRSSLANDSLRIHVASFNAAGGGTFNRDSCEYTRDLYQAQPGIKTRFWCEKGTYRE